MKMLQEWASEGTLSRINLRRIRYQIRAPPFLKIKCLVKSLIIKSRGCLHPRIFANPRNTLQQGRTASISVLKDKIRSQEIKSDLSGV